MQIFQGAKVEKHLCDKHAQELGAHELDAQEMISQTPINELLTHFIKHHTGESLDQQELLCGHCGISFSDFREDSLLGCPKCYDAFEELLLPLIQRAHQDESRHLGKIPKRSGLKQQRAMDLMRMHKALEDAVGIEDYEEAVRLRDIIKNHEQASNDNA